MTPEESANKIACQICGHQCCRWAQHYEFSMDPMEMEFYKAKGIKVYGRLMGNGEPLFVVCVPYVCPQLEEGVGCRIYDARPMACRQYKGGIDPNPAVRERCTVG